MEIKNSIHLFSTLLFVLICLSSCKKDDDNLQIFTSEVILNSCPSIVEEFCEPDSTCEVFRIVEQLPRFFHRECENLIGVSNEIKKECSDEKLKEFLRENVLYPQVAIQNNVEGIVLIEFIVRDTIGCLSNIRIVKDIGFECGIEVQRAVSTMPNFVIGRQRDKPVNVLVYVEYEFKL